MFPTKLKYLALLTKILCKFALWGDHNFITQDISLVMDERKKIAAIGTFDGVHLGHREVLRTLTEHARKDDLCPIVITFNRHPLSIIDSERAPQLLSPLWKREKLLQEAGVIPVVIDFDEKLRQTTAAQLIKQLHDDFKVEVIVVGYDNTFGCDGINFSLEDYRILGEKEGVKVIAAKEIKGVSSSAIRKAVMAGDMEKAREMLGRPFSITAKVVKGNSLGHTIGFPTANIEIPEGITIPKPGAYAAVVKILSDSSKHKAMVNIGTRPTVMRGDKPTIEAHLIDWEGDLYGQEITIRFLERLRDEKKFDSIDALRAQLSIDREDAKYID